MRNRRLTRARVVLLALLPAVAAWSVSGQEPKTEPVAQDSGGKPTVLSVVGEVDHPLALSAADLAKYERKSVKVKDHQDRDAEFEGFALADVLKEAGVPLGTALRGRALSLYLVVEAADGYRAVFSLPEVDPVSNDRPVLLADRRSGKPLGAAEGPLRVVVVGEKRQARWVRQVVTLRVARG